MSVLALGVRIGAVGLFDSPIETCSPVLWCKASHQNARRTQRNITKRNGAENLKGRGQHAVPATILSKETALALGLFTGGKAVSFCESPPLEEARLDSLFAPQRFNPLSRYGIKAVASARKGPGNCSGGIGVMCPPACRVSRSPSCQCIQTSRAA